MEDDLIQLDVLIYGQPFNFKLIEYKNWFGCTSYRKEKYREHIVRLVKEYICNNS